MLGFHPLRDLRNNNINAKEFVISNDIYNADIHKMGKIMRTNTSATKLTIMGLATNLTYKPIFKGLKANRGISKIKLTYVSYHIHIPAFVMVHDFCTYLAEAILHNPRITELEFNYYSNCFVSDSGVLSSIHTCLRNAKNLLKCSITMHCMSGKYLRNILDALSGCVQLNTLALENAKLTNPDVRYLMTWVAKMPNLKHIIFDGSYFNNDVTTPDTFLFWLKTNTQLETVTIPDIHSNEKDVLCDLGKELTEVISINTTLQTLIVPSELIDTVDWTCLHKDTKLTSVSMGQQLSRHVIDTAVCNFFSSLSANVSIVDLKYELTLSMSDMDTLIGLLEVRRVFRKLHLAFPEWDEEFNFKSTFIAVLCEYIKEVPDLESLNLVMHDIPIACIRQLGDVVAFNKTLIEMTCFYSVLPDVNNDDIEGKKMLQKIHQNNSTLLKFEMINMYSSTDFKEQRICKKIERRNNNLATSLFTALLPWALDFSD